MTMLPDLLEGSWTRPAEGSRPLVVLLFIQAQFWLSGLVDACVCQCVCVCEHQFRSCLHHNSSPLEARITKFGSEVQNTLVKQFEVSPVKHVFMETNTKRRVDPHHQFFNEAILAKERSENCPWQKKFGLKCNFVVSVVSTMHC